MHRLASFILTILAASHSHAVVPAAPSNLHTIAIAATHVDFAWQDNSNNETQFRLQRLISGTYTTIATVGANVTTASDTTVAPNTSYNYRIKAYNQTGLSAPSNVVSVTTPGPTPTPTPTPTPPPTTSYYVDPINGNDANPGSELSPWRTIQKSMNAATVGSAVNIKAGTYHERLALNVSGTAGNYITFQPLGYTGANCGASIAANGYTTCTGDQVIIDYAYLGTVTNDSTPFLNISNKSYVIIQGLTFQNYTCNGSFKQGVRIDGGSNDVQLLNNRFLHNKNIHGVQDGTSALLHIRIWGSNAITIRGNEMGDIETCQSEVLTMDSTTCANTIVESNYFHDADGIAIDLHGGAHDATIRGNLLEYVSVKRDGSTWYGNGGSNTIYVDGGNTSTIERNLVRNSGIGFAVLAEPGQPAAHHITVRDNVAYSNVHAGIEVGTWYSDTDGSSVYNISVLNNTAYGNLYGIYVRPYTSASVVWKNNIVANNATNEINTLGWPVGTMNYNLYFGDGSGPDANKIIADPKFTNAAASPPDLSLQSISPAKNAGDPGFVLGIGETDFLGNPRVVGGRVDMGAYEVQP